MDILPLPGCIQVYGNHCNGCERNKKDIMIAFMHTGQEFYDVFLSNEEALKLANNLVSRVGGNTATRTSNRGPQLSDLP